MDKYPLWANVCTLWIKKYKLKRIKDIESPLYKLYICLHPVAINVLKMKRIFKFHRTMMRISFLLTFTMLFAHCTRPVKISQELYNNIQEGFTTPADTNKPWCYYYWIGDDISKEGITKDLEAMKEFGLGAVLIGNINPDEGGCSMFEPMGGSAPKYTGQGVINPIAAIAAMAMLLEQCGADAAADRILTAVKSVTGSKMQSQSAGKMGFSTSEVGDLVVAAL